MDILRLKSYLDSLVLRYNHISFIQDDPISIPKQFSKRQDIEIIGFWTAMLAWGRRSTIIAKAGELATWMDNSPYDFILNHKESDRKPFLNFKHRTFQGDDALYFLHFFPILLPTPQYIGGCIPGRRTQYRNQTGINPVLRNIYWRSTHDVPN